jgi:hypothetical protein
MKQFFQTNLLEITAETTLVEKRDFLSFLWVLLWSAAKMALQHSA